MAIHTFNGKTPTIHPTAYVADSADVCGDVTLAEDASVLFGAVVRGDIQPITIGPKANIQDNCVIHVVHNGQGTHVGAGVCMGHGVILHECRIGDWCLLGMGAIVLDRAVVGPESYIGAGAVVTPGTIIPPGVLALGTPAKPVRELTEAEKWAVHVTADRYMRVARSYRTGEPYLTDEEAGQAGPKT